MNKIRGFFAGSGVDAFSNSYVVDKLLSMVSAHFTLSQCEQTSNLYANDINDNNNTGNNTSSKNVKTKIAYLGTATYDALQPQQAQTRLLKKRGCEVKPIKVADPSITQLTSEQINFLRHEADIILVSGGNTLYAIRRWQQVGLDMLLKQLVLERDENKTTTNKQNHNKDYKDVILAGGSAGAICWFTSGHSDSADPSTFRSAINDPNANVNNTEWSYIRVHGLNILPGMICPHFDKTQSNLIPRRDDFARMLKRHPTEHGIGIDHWAVLILLGDGQYEVYSVPDKQRASDAHSDNMDNAQLSSSSSSSKPGVYTLDVKDGQVHQHRIAASGSVSEIIRPPTGPVINDPFERFYAMSNPTPSSGSLIVNNRK